MENQLPLLDLSPMVSGKRGRAVTLQDRNKDALRGFFETRELKA